MVAILSLVLFANQFKDPTRLSMSDLHLSLTEDGNGLVSSILSTGNPERYGVLFVLVVSWRSCSCRSESRTACCDRWIPNRVLGVSKTLIFTPKK